MQGSCGAGIRLNVGALPLGLAPTPALSYRTRQTPSLALMSTFQRGINRQVVKSQQPLPSRPVLAVGSSSPDSPTSSTKRGGLAQRAISGVVLGGLAALVIRAGGVPFTVVACLAAWQCSREYVGLIRAAGLAEGMEPPSTLVCWAVTLSCVMLNAWTGLTRNKTAGPLALAVFVVMTLQTFSATRPRYSQLASTAFGLVYCGYLVSFWLRLRFISASVGPTPWLATVCPGGVSVGLASTLLSVLCVIAADTGAYFTGRWCGKTQLHSISPKKTVEGAAGGLAAAIVTAVAGHKALGWPAGSVAAAGLGTLVFLSSVAGDLIESVIKRDAGLKDASNLIPGHGGLLDRLDSYLFTGACVFFYVSSLLATQTL